MKISSVVTLLLWGTLANATTGPVDLDTEATKNVDDENSSNRNLILWPPPSSKPTTPYKPPVQKPTTPPISYTPPTPKPTAKPTQNIYLTPTPPPTPYPTKPPTPAPTSTPTKAPVCKIAIKVSKCTYGPSSSVDCKDFKDFITPDNCANAEFDLVYTVSNIGDTLCTFDSVLGETGINLSSQVDPNPLPAGQSSLVKETFTQNVCGGAVISFPVTADAHVFPNGLPTSASTSYKVTLPPFTRRPTKAPTPSPTLPPTRRPSLRPSSKPTFKPTGYPTKKPTAKPTSYKPTAKPTIVYAPPTYKPTAKPTFNIYFSPTPKPTYPPSKKPTYLTP